MLPLSRFNVQEDVNSLANSLVDVLEISLKKGIAFSGMKPIGLATGRTMLPVYAKLVERIKCWKKSDLEKLRKSWCSFNLDEYVGLDPWDKNSFKYYIDSYLGGPLSLNRDKMYGPDGNAKDPCLEAKSYSRHIKKLGGVGIQLLGVGVNGHIGFNEPPCTSRATCRVVSLTESTREQNASCFLGGLRNVPSQAITLGISEILDAEEIHLVVTGSEKSAVLKSFIDSQPNKHLPVSWLRNHKNLFVWTDTKAINNQIKY